MSVILQKGSAHTAIAPITVRPSGVPCQVQLSLTDDEGASFVATSGPIDFTSTGAQQSISLPITMPTSWGEFDVYIDVLYSGELIRAYVATESVIVPDVVIGPPVWE